MELRHCLAGILGYFMRESKVQKLVGTDRCLMRGENQQKWGDKYIDGLVRWHNR